MTHTRARVATLVVVTAAALTAVRTQAATLLTRRPFTAAHQAHTPRQRASSPFAALGPAPTEAQVRALLAAQWSAATAKDKRRFCAVAYAPSLCESQWDHVGGSAAVPAAAPRIAGIRVQGPYRAARVCGVDGLGREYRSDFLVQLHDGRPEAVMAVFWDDRRWSGLYLEGDEPRTVSTEAPPDHGPPC